MENVSFGENVDFLRCQWVEESEAGFTGLVMTLRTWYGEAVTISPKIVGLPAGRFEVHVDGVRTRAATLEKAADLELDIEVGAEEATVCLLQK